VGAIATALDKDLRVVAYRAGIYDLPADSDQTSLDTLIIRDDAADLAREYNELPPSRRRFASLMIEAWSEAEAVDQTMLAGLQDTDETVLKRFKELTSEQRELAISAFRVWSIE
jgi:hypothetical protein